jgi:NTP pyrophosphatase (non-canonical NTP hydrolase)
MWGNMNHDPETWLTILTEEVGEIAKSVLDMKFNDGDTNNYRDELVQVAAVCVAALESLYVKK